MMIPNLVPGHDPHTQTFVRSAKSSETGLVFRIELAPGAGKLLDVHLNAEVVFKNLLQRSCRTHMTRQETNVVQIRVIRNSASLTQSLSAQTQQIEEAAGKTILSRFLVLDEKAILFPAPVEE